MATLTPSLSPDETVTLIVGLAGHRFSVGLHRVRTIVETGAGNQPLTPLPWTRPPVEGLARVDGRPVVQVGNWGPAGDGRKTPGGWLLVIKGPGPGDEMALRVDEVLGLADEGAAPVEPLPLSRLWQGFGAGREAPAPAGETDDATTGQSASGAVALEVLLLDIRGERLALLLDGVRGIASVEAVDTVTTLGGGRQRLARVEGRLLPALVLSERFGAEPMIGRWAVVGGAIGHEVALLLPEGAGFDRIAIAALERLPAVPGALAWWRRGAAEPPVGLYDFATLTGTPGTTPVLDLSPAPLAVQGRSAAWQQPGAVRLRCAGLLCSLPLALVGNALDPDQTPASGTVSRRSPPGAIPVLDGCRLLTGRRSGRSGHWLRLGLPGGPELVLVIDGLEPEFPDADHPWLAAPSLPAGPAALIEAVCWDAIANTWVLRLCPTLDFPSLPMVAKKAVAGALIGWLPTTVYSRGALPANTPHQERDAPGPA
jgi:hypothetical protein